jgi:hypothetical protein
MKKYFIAPLVAAAPLIASAQITDLFSGIDYVMNILRFLLTAMMPLATLFFFWNMIKYIRESGEGKPMTDAKNGMAWSAVGLFMMVGIWTVVWYVQTSLGIGGSEITTGPVFPTKELIK